MNNANIDIYFLVFAAIFLFSIFLVFIIAFFAYYRKKQRNHYREKEALTIQFRNELFQTQLEVQELTYNHISQEIHDNVGQILSLAKVQINIMKETERVEQQMLNEIKDNIGKAMSDLRDIAKSLNTERIRSLCLLDSVTDETDRINKSGIITITLQTEGTEKEMDPQKKLILFRIIQESLQNILKHARASTVCINFSYLDYHLLVTIRDDGQGFDVDYVLGNKAGLGLSNIKTRARLAGGGCQLQSALNEGTTLFVTMPYQ